MRARVTVDRLCFEGLTCGREIGSVLLFARGFRNRGILSPQRRLWALTGPKIKPGIIRTYDAEHTRNMVTFSWLST